MASMIPGAEFLPLPSGTHNFPIDDTLTCRMAEAIDRFTGWRRFARPIPPTNY